MIGKIPQNHVLVEVDCLRHKKVAFQDGTQVIVDPSFVPEQHANTNGIVKAIPESLFFDKSDVFECSQYLSDIDVEVGDRIFFHYLQINEAVKHKKYLEEDGKFYVFIRHDSLFCGIRGEDIIMFNGWMLLEPVDVEKKKYNTVITTLPKDRQKKDPLKGKIIHVGSAVGQRNRY